MIAAKAQIKAEQHVEVIHLDRAEAQMVRSHLKQKLVKLERLFHAPRIHVPARKPLGFEAQPAIRLAAAVFFQVELVALGLAEASHRRKAFLNSFEEVEQRFTVMRQIELRAQPHVHVEILTKSRVRIRHTAFS